MESTIARLIHYYHDCYQADKRDLEIYDFLDRKIQHKIYFEEREELVTNEAPKTAVAFESAEKLLKTYQLFEKEKELLYGTFFLCGQYTSAKGESKRLCAPLFYYPANITLEDDIYFLSLNTDDLRFNYALLSLLSDGKGGEVFSDPLFTKLPQEYITFDHINVIVRFCEKYFPQINLENCYAYPNNAKIKSLKSKIAKIVKQQSDEIQLIPAGILGLVHKSTSAQGLLDELSQLANKKQFSPPLQNLLGTQNIGTQNSEYLKGEIPLVLSQSQQALLESASVNPLTVIVGPPGTGKSYTIAAMAIEHMSRGESVLIGSRTDEAVDVILEKLHEQLGFSQHIVRGGSKRSYATTLRRYLKSLLTRNNVYAYLCKELGMDLGAGDLNEKIAELQKVIDSQLKTTDKYERKYMEEVETEMDWGAYLAKEEKGLWARLKERYMGFKNKRQEPLWNLSHKMFEIDHELRINLLRRIRLRYIQRILSAIKYHRDDFVKYYQLLNTFGQTEKLNKMRGINFQNLVSTFPVWLTRLSDLNELLPLQDELFDVAIIDEATQCDMASCIPLIQRAKRVVFAGDPNQLKHVSFLSRSIQSLFKEKYALSNVDTNSLNYRDNSVLDLAINALQSNNQVAVLDEHFRSKSAIIRFSNEQFYNRELQIMTSRPDEREQVIHTISCKGVRDSNGENVKEAERLLEDISRLINEEQQLEEAYATSVGILSPFRAQVELMSRLLIERYSAQDITKHKIRVGTAYSFQGEERDIMFLSFCVDAQSHHSAFNHINKNAVFNVAITRARIKQYVYLSLTTEQLKGNSLLRSYLSDITINHEPEFSAEIHDQFLNELMLELENMKIRGIWPAFGIAGTQIDLLIKVGGRYLGIDLIGYPGEFREAFNLERIRVLQRASVKMFPIPYSDWYFAREEVVCALRKFLELDKTDKLSSTA